MQPLKLHESNGMTSLVNVGAEDTILKQVKTFDAADRINKVGKWSEWMEQLSSSIDQSDS